jgi:sugar lactone lactonase YvrE
LIKHYTNVDGLPYIEASSVTLDARHHKWIGTLGGGLARLDSAGNAWTVFTRNDGLASDTVLCTAAGGQNVFAGGYGSLSYYDGYNWFSLLAQQGYELGNRTQALAARDDSLWIATDQGLRIVKVSPLSSIRDTNNWTTFSNYDGLSSDVRCILLTDTLSMIGAANGAARLVGGAWQRIPGLGDQVRSIVQIGDSLFLATNNGVKLWRQNVLSDISPGLLSYNVLSLSVDEGQILWAGCDRGLCRYDGGSWKAFVFDCMKDNNINDLAVGSGGVIWLAHPQSGISYYRDDRCNYLNQTSTGWPINQPSHIGVSSDNSLWVGTWGLGLFVKRPDDLWLAYSSPTPLTTPYIGQILPVPGGVYLINYDLPDGIDAISFFWQQDSTWRSFNAPTNKFYPISILFDKQQNLWVGSYYNGLYRRSPEGIWVNWSPTSGLASNYVAALCLDSRENLWIGTDNGLFYYDGKTFLSYRTDNSPILSNNVVSLSRDRSDNLWIGTDSGLSCLTWDGQWKNYSQDNRYDNSSKLISNSIIKVLAMPGNSTGDDIYIATAQGLSLFRYNDVIQRTVDQPYVAPNPFNMTRDGHIYFSNLPSEARIDIYTLDGRPCGTFYGPPAPAHTLTIRPGNEFSRQPVSGIYLCRIRSSGQKPYICKLVIVR